MSDGIDVTGTGLSVAFGRAETGARTALVKLAGPERAAQDLPGCGHVVRYADGLVAVFQADRFVGWQQPDGRTAGIACES